MIRSTSKQAAVVIDGVILGEPAWSGATSADGQPIGEGNWVWDHSGIPSGVIEPVAVAGKAESPKGQKGEVTPTKDDTGATWVTKDTKGVVAAFKLTTDSTDVKSSKVDAKEVAVTKG